MSIKQTVLNHKEEINSTYKKYGCIQPELFGSVARGEDTEDSDIDLLYVALPDTGYLAIISIEMELKQLFNRRVELVNSKTLIPIFEPYINKDRIML